jgi:hypothetical protein
VPCPILLVRAGVEVFAVVDFGGGGGGVAAFQDSSVLIQSMEPSPYSMRSCARTDGGARP